MHLAVGAIHDACTKVGVLLEDEAARPPAELADALVCLDIQGDGVDLQRGQVIGSSVLKVVSPSFSLHDCTNLGSDGRHSILPLVIVKL